MCKLAKKLLIFSEKDGILTSVKKRKERDMNMMKLYASDLDDMIFADTDWYPSER